MINEDKFTNLVYWIEERESIRRKKERGDPQPWTEDEILATYRFCNVCRRDDRVSQWLLKNLYVEDDHPLLWLQACVARWINWPPMLEEIQEMWNYSRLNPAWFTRVGEMIDTRVARGEKAWTGAYMITARALPQGMGKGVWIMEQTIKPLYDNRHEFEYFFTQDRRSVELATELFNGRFNHGSFMAGQIISDWTYTPLMSDAVDLYTWAPVGPGSARGMNKLHDRQTEQLLKQPQFTEELQELVGKLSKKIPELSDDLTAMNVQNCLCEWDKYTRIQNGGQVRVKYTPETRF